MLHNAKIEGLAVVGADDSGPSLPAEARPLRRSSRANHSTLSGPTACANIENPAPNASPIFKFSTQERFTSRNRRNSHKTNITTSVYSRLKQALSEAARQAFPRQMYDNRRVPKNYRASKR
jgi:hypothetical protein